MSFQGIIQTSNQKTIVLIRVLVGAVSLMEGIQKFLYPSLRGAGRFEKNGIREC